MSFLINTKKKKIYIFDLIALILLSAVIVTVVILVVSPISEVFPRNDELRRTHLNQFGSGVKTLSVESGTGFLSEISNCVDKYDQIGKGESQVDLESLIGEYIEYEEDFLHDPKATPDDTGYEICKSLNGTRVQFNAPLADLRENITSGVNLDE